MKFAQYDGLDDEGTPLLPEEPVLHATEDEAAESRPSWQDQLASEQDASLEG